MQCFVYLFVSNSYLYGECLQMGFFAEAGPVQIFVSNHVSLLVVLPFFQSWERRALTSFYRNIYLLPWKLQNFLNGKSFYTVTICWLPDPGGFITPCSYEKNHIMLWRPEVGVINKLHANESFSFFFNDG